MSQFKPLSISRLSVGKMLLVGLSLPFIFSALVLAADTIGVGVGTGRITLDDPVKPGLTYSLPSIAVFNSGTVTSDYEMSVQYNETQPEEKPAADWVTFTPQTFTLPAGGSQEVKVELKTSSSTKPAAYFAYLEAHPTKKDTSSATAIKIAAATKFHFDVQPANFFQRIYYALLDFWNRHRSIIIPVLCVLAFVLIVLIGKRFLHVELRRK